MAADVAMFAIEADRRRPVHCGGRPLTDALRRDLGPAERVALAVHAPKPSIVSRSRLGLHALGRDPDRHPLGEATSMVTIAARLGSGRRRA